MPIPIQTARQIPSLRNAFGLFGALRLKLDETVVPVAILEDLHAEGWRNAFSADVRGLSGAGNTHKWSLSNPAASGALVELTELVVGSSVTQQWQVTVIGTPYVPGTVLVGEWQDLDGVYAIPDSFPITNPRHAMTAAAMTGQPVWTALILPNTMIAWNPKVVLHPGQAIVLWAGAVNQDGQVSWQWRERPLLPGER